MPNAPIETWSGPLGEIRAASAANGGTALSSTAVVVPIPDATAHLWLLARNFSASANVLRYALNPYLIVLVTPDDLSTDTDYSQKAQDPQGTSYVVLDALNTLASKGYVLIGCRTPIRGLAVTSQTANTNAATLAVAYWKGSWANVAGLTDGTASGGDTLAQNGNVTWTVPSDAVAANLVGIKGTGIGSAIVDSQITGYWYRLSVSAQLSATVRVSGVYALNRSTTYAEHVAGQPLELRIDKGFPGIAAVEAATDAGTGSLLVNCATRYGAAFTH